MKWILIALITMFAFSLMQVWAERSEIYWENVGPNVDRTMNPDTHQQGED